MTKLNDKWLSSKVKVEIFMEEARAAIETEDFLHIENQPFEAAVLIRYSGPSFDADEFIVEALRESRSAYDKSYTQSP